MESNAKTASALLTVAPAPHLRHGDRTATIMYDVLLALCPALIWGIYLFGPRALLICMIGVASAVLSEFLWEKATRRPITVRDGSAILTGLLLGMNLPVAVPLWIPALGSAFAIIFVKQLFGGLGKNFANPALTARIFLFLSFPSFLTLWASDEANMQDWWRIGVPQEFDTVTGATPLAQMMEGRFSPLTDYASRYNLFFGFRAGSIGEVCAIAILLGGAYLLIRRVITWHIPVGYLGTMAILAFLFPMHGADRFTNVLCQLCAGGVLFAAFFMATDYVTCPITKKGRLLFGVGCGLLTFLFRRFGAYPEGVSFAIVLMNLLTPYIDLITRPRPFGTSAKRAPVSKS